MKRCCSVLIGILACGPGWGEEATEASQKAGVQAAVAGPDGVSAAGQARPDARPEDEPTPAAPKYSLYDQFFRGGFWMWPILFCSIIGLAFSLERLIHMRRSVILPEPILKQVQGPISQDSRENIREVCRTNPSCLGRVLLAALERSDFPLAEMERAVDEQCSRELYEMRKNMRPLGMVATVAPMFGLLGTVSGMISAFDVVASHGALGNPKLLSGSIAEALLTTGFGLIVAIPALMLHHHFRGRAENLLVEISDITDHILLGLEVKGHRAAPPEAPSQAEPISRPQAEAAKSSSTTP